MEYELIYDAANASFEGWSFLSIGTLFIFLGTILVFSENARNIVSRNNSESSVRLFSKIFLGFSIVTTFLGGGFSYLSHNETKKKSLRNTCSVVEGTVTNFSPMPYGGNQLETFEVNQVKFGYSDYVITGGFNNTASHGGPIRSSLHVRICYFERTSTNSNIIARLEILH